MPTLSRFLRAALPAAAFALSLAAAPHATLAQTTLDTSYAIGLEHARTEPYNFTGRIFDLDNVAFGSGTLIRRHTVLTAGHVTFDATTGFFLGNATFTRGLYEDFSYQKSQIISATALSGYQAAATTDGEDSLTSFARDMGVVLIMDAPIDLTWGSYLVDPTVLSDTSNQFFQLGYPGVTFDGRTMAYIVPSSTFTQVGAIDSGLFENDGYTGEPGESGGPLYAYTGGKQYIVGEFLGGIDDSTGEFNASFIRAIDTTANNFITAAEYNAGLIAKVKIKGPRTVTHGTTVIYTALPKFLVPNPGSTLPVTTNRYSEVKLKTSTPGTSTVPVVSIKKLSYTQFSVTFAATIHPRTTTTISAYFSKTAQVPDSTITITVN